MWTWKRHVGVRSKTKRITYNIPYWRVYKIYHGRISELVVTLVPNHKGVGSLDNNPTVTDTKNSSHINALATRNHVSHRAFC